MGYIAIVLATAWTAVVVGTILESVDASAGSIVFLRRTLLTPGNRTGVLIMCGLAASAGLALAAAVAYQRGRRLKRRQASELDARTEEMATRAAGDVARAGLLSWRVEELQTSMEDLTNRRDQILDEMETAQRRTSELRKLSDDYKRSVSEMQDRLIVLPDTEDELERRRSQRQSADPAG
ncbi:MAG: hypothetical protein ACRDG8_08760 [Actinomycetota bacterium]